MMIDNITTFSEEYLAAHPEINYFLYGHLHLLERFLVSSGKEKAEVIVLGEWLSRFSYAYWDGDNLSLMRYEENSRKC